MYRDFLNYFVVVSVLFMCISYSFTDFLYGNGVRIKREFGFRCFKTIWRNSSPYIRRCIWLLIANFTADLKYTKKE